MQVALQQLESDETVTEDSIQTEDAFGGLVDPTGDVLRFTYFARDAQERWDVVVTTDQVKRIAKKRIKTLPRLKERPPWQLDVPSGVYIESESEAQAKLSELETLLRSAGKEGRREEPEDGDAAEVDLAAILGAAFDSEPGEDALEEDASEEQLQGARQFLKLLLDAGALELEKGAVVDQIAAAIAPVLDSAMRPYAKAEALTSMLFDRDDVVEVYVADDELAKLLEKW